MEKTSNHMAPDYKKIFTSSPSAFLLLLPDSPDYTIIDASDEYLNATLTYRDEIIGKKLFDVFPDNPESPQADSTKNLRASLERVIQTKYIDSMAIQKYDIPLPADLGGGFEERYWNPVNKPVFDNQHKIMYIIHYVEDVTSTVYLQKELETKARYIKENEERINMILNALLKYTTLDFSEKLALSDKGDELDAISFGLNTLIDELENQMSLLKASNKELEYANHELDSFSYSVSHDLRSPLRAINGYAQVLIEDYSHLLDDDGKKVIDVIIRNAHKMGHLIDDLLTFSRVGKQNITKVFLNMDSITETIVKEFSILPRTNEPEFKINPMHAVKGDNSMIKQVLTNLIANAIKYSGKKDQPVIEIGSYIENNDLIFYIKDNGVGFDMKYYDKLFGVFQRLHSSAEFEGTGVGLALVQRIIKKHQGEVWAEAIVNEGATFYFSLPNN